MRKDDLLYKILLSVIALSLVVIAVTLLFRSGPIEAKSQTDFASIKLAYTRGGFLLMDPATGDIWMYGFGGQKPDFIGRLKELGSPLLTR